MSELTVALIILTSIGMLLWIRSIQIELTKQRKITAGLAEHVILNRVALKNLIGKSVNTKSGTKTDPRERG
jgi:hypothetical protein